MYSLENDVLTMTQDPNGGLVLGSPRSAALRLGPLVPGLSCDGLHLRIARQVMTQGEHVLEVTTDFAPLEVRLVQRFQALDRWAITGRCELINFSARSFHLTSIQLLETAPDRPAAVRLAEEASSVRLYEQTATWAQVRDLTAAAPSPSQLCWVGYDRRSPFALAAGFLSSERWLGEIRTEGEAGQHPSSWRIGFDGGDLLVDPQERLQLEDILLQAGSDPLDLLEEFGRRVQQRHNRPVPRHSTVSWCSWYPYRLGVTEDRILANARLAAERLQPLGLEIIETDLGWERDYLPSAYEENTQFPHGLQWLAGQLDGLGFRLGVWNAPLRISEFDPAVSNHPEWLLGTAEQQPMPQGRWYWEPFGQTYYLDLTHPEAQNWLRENVRSLALRGVKYYKFDFLRCNATLRKRHNEKIVAGGGCEALRLGLQIMSEEVQSAGDGAIGLNISPVDMPGTGALPLLYSCDDTGNTGYLGWNHLAEDYGKNVAGHLWKQGRWGVIQPSCLCVGLPGSLEEARVRATATFLSGGQVDISDDLTTLPEDRWQVLEATLPPLSRAARPVDLFDPIILTWQGYDGMDCAAENEVRLAGEVEGARIWHLPVVASWDRWALVGIFNYDHPPQNPKGRDYLLPKFRLPLERLGIEPSAEYWAYEFWSGQFLGSTRSRPIEPNVPREYIHAGDVRTLMSIAPAGALDFAFYGPAVKLLVLRAARVHPWVAGTGFHQSNGAELEDVVWDGGALSGRLRRPAGQCGSITIAGGGRAPVRAVVAGEPVTVRPGAHGCFVLPLLTKAAVTEWAVHWED
jgi:hypothetical protein